MPNSVKFSINSASGVTEVFLTQDAQAPTTIHAVLDGSGTHDITNAEASAEGNQVTGKTRWWFFEDTVNLMLSGLSATLSIEGYKDFTGSMSAADSAAAVAFVKACKLPMIS